MVGRLARFSMKRCLGGDNIHGMVKPVFQLGPSADAKAIREEVFCAEQGFKNEFDELDPTSTSLVLYLDGYPIATGRIGKVDPATYAIGRVAVRKPYRGMRIGSYLMEFLCERARQMGAKTVMVHAQLDKRGFYNRLGFYEFAGGVIDEDEGVPHIHLAKDLYASWRPGGRRRRP